MDTGAENYRRYLQGDDKAFEAIIKEYRTGLTFFVNRYVHNMAVAEDLVIDAFADLIVHKKRYNFKSSLKTYLFMIGRSRALDYLKHNKKIRLEELTAEERDAYIDFAFEERIFADERKCRLNAAVQMLQPQMRAAVHLVYFEELSYAEAAKVMKKSRKQIDNLLYRAKQILREAMGEDGDSR
ncbi:MAG: sigma-70 family RNA polymerase sigma factor [Clostridia bacterium]|nr:sigma-70 family RNA polymerase sigma factor [Clostridia bacterium]